ncbi:carbohydrate ABC transporter permease [Roseixanthobacter pseudopolyaromaticivorans]|uniref:carbohydrate ABC transporter permease n=1 Tax=Xanthobacteraceae TaxID=335928 RepID=UPI00372AD837
MRAKRLLKSLGTAGRWVALGGFLAWSIFPLYLVVASSFKPARDIFEVPPRLIFQPTLENYVRLWNDWPVFFDGLINSLIVTLGATLLTVVASALAGWVFSRFSSRFLTLSAFSMIVLRLLPPIVITLPLFPLVNYVGLNDTHLILILLYATFFISLGSWIMKASFDQIPRELEEAGAVDGASFAGILRHISMPLGIPGMIAAGVFVFIFAWNEYLFAFIFTTTAAKTAPVVLSEIMGSATGVDWGVLFAAATIQLVPIVAVLILAQRYLIEGLTSGSVKG